MRLLIVSLLLILIALSCNKDEAIMYGANQSPVMMLSGDLDFETGIINFGDYAEMGCSMEMLTNGRIRHLCILMPDYGAYRTTLWALPSMEVIASVNIEGFFGQTRCLEIPTHYVEAGDRIAVTVYSEDWYRYVPFDDARPIYPVEVGDVRVLEYAYKSEPIGFQFPDNLDFFKLEGIADIIFEPEI